MAGHSMSPAEVDALVALVEERQRIIAGYGDGTQNLQELDGRLAVNEEALLTWSRPAAPPVGHPLVEKWRREAAEYPIATDERPATNEHEQAAQQILVTLAPLVSDAAIVGRTYGWPEVLAVVNAAAKKLASPAPQPAAWPDHAVGTINSIAHEIGDVMTVAERRRDPDADTKQMLARLEMWRSRLLSARPAAAPAPPPAAPAPVWHCCKAGGAVCARYKPTGIGCAEGECDLASGVWAAPAPVEPHDWMSERQADWQHGAPVEPPPVMHEMAELLRSACAIADRLGADTAWERFGDAIRALGLNGVTARTYRVLPHERPNPLGHQAGVQCVARAALASPAPQPAAPAPVEPPPADMATVYGKRFDAIKSADERLEAMRGKMPDAEIDVYKAVLAADARRKAQE